MKWWRDFISEHNSILRSCLVSHTWLELVGIRIVLFKLSVSEFYYPQFFCRILMSWFQTCYEKMNKNGRSRAFEISVLINWTVIVTLQNVVSWVGQASDKLEIILTGFIFAYKNLSIAFNLRTVTFCSSRFSLVRPVNTQLVGRSLWVHKIL